MTIFSRVTKVTSFVSTIFLVSCATRNIQSLPSTEASFADVRLIKIYDGDSITVEIPGVHPLLGNRIGVRLYGLDTAERRTKNSCEKTKALEAKQVVEKALYSATRIDLENCKRGKYFRIVCSIKYDRKSLANLLLSQKLAYPYFGKTKKKINWCDGSESPWIPASKRKKQEY